LFLLWFGLGNVTAVLLVAVVSAFPIVFNTWAGVKAVKEIWVRSAQAMGADNRRLLHHVILPGALCAHRFAAGLGPGLAHPCRHGDARRGVVGARLDDFRRARIFEHRRAPRRRRCHRRHRARAGEARVPAARAVHRRSLGDDVVNVAAARIERATSAYRAGLTLLIAAACYEAAARSGGVAAARSATLAQ